MAQASAGGHTVGFGATERRDRWWVGPAFTAAALSAWLLYYVFVAWQGAYYSGGPYLSPFYPTYVHALDPADTSPTNAFFGYGPTWWPWFITPALFLGFLPGVFRLSCYYYRKAYYRAFFGMPPGCAVGPRQTDYRGETGLLVVQNLHRYTLYIAIALLPILYLEAFRSFVWKGQPGIGVGSILLTTNCVLLTAYTFGCHAWRHLVGGRLDCFSCDGLSQTRHGAWRLSSWLNQRHMEFAWSSLVAIFLADLYVRLFAHGWMPDLNTWHGLSWVTEFVH